MKKVFTFDLQSEKLFGVSGRTRRKREERMNDPTTSPNSRRYGIHTVGYRKIMGLEKGISGCLHSKKIPPYRVALYITVVNFFVTS